jgi:hypothetical protein
MAPGGPAGVLVVVDSQAMVKKLFSSKVATALSYLTGGGFIVVGAIGLSLRLMTLCQRMGYCDSWIWMGKGA